MRRKRLCAPKISKASYEKRSVLKIYGTYIPLCSALALLGFLELTEFSELPDLRVIAYAEADTNTDLEASNQALEAFMEVTANNAPLGFREEAKTLAAGTISELRPALTATSNSEGVGNYFDNGKDSDGKGEGADQTASSDLPYCSETSKPLRIEYSCTAPVATASCSIMRRLFASAITPLGVSNGGAAAGGVASSSGWLVPNYENYSERTNGNIGIATFKVGSGTTHRGSCTVFSESRSFIIDSPEAIESLLVKGISYKDYMRLSVSVTNVPSGWYEGYLGPVLEENFSAGVLGEPSFSNSRNIFTVPNGYLPPIVPLPRKDGKVRCYGTRFTHENLNLDIWPEIQSLLPGKFKMQPFMLTIKNQVSVVGDGFATSDLELRFRNDRLSMVNDLTTDSISCLDKLFGESGSTLRCASGYVHSGAFTGSGVSEFRNPASSIEVYRGPWLPDSVLTLPKELSDLSISIGSASGSEQDQSSMGTNAMSSHAILSGLASSPYCRIWQGTYVEDSQTSSNSNETVPYDAAPRKALSGAEYPLCSSGLPQGYSCTELSHESFTDAQGAPHKLSHFACSLRCLDENSSKDNNGAIRSFLNGSGCRMVTRRLTTPENHIKVEEIPCEEFYSEEGGYTDNCRNLAQDPACERIESHCLDDDEARLFVNEKGEELLSECGMKTVLYRCTRSIQAQAGDVLQVAVCDDAPVPCMGEACVESMAPEGDSKRGNALGALGVLEYMQDDMDCSSGVCRIFTGKEHTCRCGIKGSFDCCAIKTRVSPYDYIKLSTYIMTLEGAGSLVKNELADFGSWTDISKNGSALISSELDSLIGEYGKEGLGTVRSSFLEELSNKTADLVERLFGRDLREKLFTEGAAGSAQAGTTLNPEVLNCAQGLMQAYVAFKMAETAYEIITACHENEYETSMRIDMDSCVYVGSECDHKLLGRCLVRKRHYCCYNSPLARIIMNGLREQGYSGAQCSGISAGELSHYDLGLIDLTEWNELVTSSGVVPADKTSLDILTGSGSVLNTGERLDSLERTKKRIESVNTTMSKEMP